jgi:hypothetical protein
MKILITLSTSLLLCLSTFPQTFSDDFTGIDIIRRGHYNNYPAQIQAFYNDGDSVLYIGGAISFVNGMSVYGIFSWNTEEIKTYHQDENRISGADCICKYNDSIYAGGGLIIT